MKEATRIEKDSLGSIEVPIDRYFGSQTARSLRYFPIGEDVLPRAMIRALGLIKQAAAKVHCELGLLPSEKGEKIAEAAEEVAMGKWDAEFPVSIWQTGSGTHSNMNANEVIANVAIEKLGGTKGDKTLIHPNDHVNLSQSSNDVFPTAMHIAAVEEMTHRLLPALQKLRKALQSKEEAFASIVKIGRTHLMDAVPLSLGQEFSGYVTQLQEDEDRILFSLKDLYKLALGGTAVGTGLNAHPEFGKKAIEKIAEVTRLAFLPAHNRYSLLAAHDAMVFASSCLKTLAASLMKIANDIRWMGSGPECGLYELLLPENEPGSSIMPGKVNPTQCEAMMMVAVQVMGNDTAIAIAGAQGNFELNVFKPMIIHNFLHSVTLLADACHAFTDFLVAGLKANLPRLEFYLDHSLMLVTCLVPKVGYDQAAKMARKALQEHKTLKEAAIELGLFSKEEFDLLVQPKKMIE